MPTGWPMDAYVWWDASCRWTWNSRAQLRLGPVLPSVDFNLRRSSPYSKSQHQAMTMLGVALHRSIKLWLQPAGQSPCSVYERTSDLIRLKLNARVCEKRGLNEQASIYYYYNNNCSKDKASIYAPHCPDFLISPSMRTLEKVTVVCSTNIWMLSPYQARW